MKMTAEQLQKFAIQHELEMGVSISEDRPGQYVYIGNSETGTGPFLRSGDNLSYMLAARHIHHVWDNETGEKVK